MEEVTARFFLVSFEDFLLQLDRGCAKHVTYEVYPHMFYWSDVRGNTHTHSKKKCEATL